MATTTCYILLVYSKSIDRDRISYVRISQSLIQFRVGGLVRHSVIGGNLCFWKELDLQAPDSTGSPSSLEWMLQFDPDCFHGREEFIVSIQYCSPVWDWMTFGTWGNCSFRIICWRSKAASTLFLSFEANPGRNFSPQDQQHSRLLQNIPSIGKVLIVPYSSEESAPRHCCCVQYDSKRSIHRSFHTGCRRQSIHRGKEGFGMAGH